VDRDAVGFDLMRLHRSREGMDTILMAVIVHRFTPNLKGTRSGKLEEKPTLYYNGRSKMQEHFVTIVLKRRRDDLPDRDG
jgi:hypothetical protein